MVRDVCLEEGGEKDGNVQSVDGTKEPKVAPPINHLKRIREGYPSVTYCTASYHTVYSIIDGDVN